VSACLLDVNVLVALMWPAHEAHARVTTWLESNHKVGWATCPYTQTSVVRLLSNPAFSKHALSPPKAEQALAANLQRPSHRFWPADIDYSSAISTFGDSISGHKQVSDAYLLGLTIHRRGKFVTLDHRIRAILPETSRFRDLIIEI